MGRRKYTDEQLAEAIAASRTMREVLVRLRLAPYAGKYETVWRRCTDLRIDSSNLRRLPPRRPMRSCTDAEVIEAIRTSRSSMQAIRKLGLAQGGNSGRLKQRIRALGVDTSHMLGRGWKLGDRTRSSRLAL